MWRIDHNVAEFDRVTMLLHHLGRTREVFLPYSFDGDFFRLCVGR